jgi:hypothetical protein
LVHLEDTEQRRVRTWSFRNAYPVKWTGGDLNASGTEFLTRVKALYPDTIRIVLSGYTDLATVTGVINEGAIYKFLTKPWNDDALRHDIRQASDSIPNTAPRQANSRIDPARPFDCATPGTALRDEQGTIRTAIRVGSDSGDRRKAGRRRPADWPAPDGRGAARPESAHPVAGQQTRALPQVSARTAQTYGRMQHRRSTLEPRVVVEMHDASARQSESELIAKHNGAAGEDGVDRPARRRRGA